MNNTPRQELPRALGLTRPPAVFRQAPEDFVVEEILGFALTGEGEHLWLQVEKTGLNTIDVVRRLARHTGVREQHIGYAGLKDKQAVATQWFSLPGVDDVTIDVDTDGVRILRQVRNQRKLRRGSHQGNRFVITLREVPFGEGALSDWQARIGRCGVPNYFGPQRFGVDGANLDRARQWFAGTAGRVSRYQRGLYLSAARAFLFNSVLAARVDGGSWDRYLPGDVMALAGSGSVFLGEADDERIPSRLAGGDIHPTGPLWGAGELKTRDETRLLEVAIATSNKAFADGLAKAGLAQERRPLRVIPENLKVASAGPGQVVVEFSLPRGTYATSVLREMVEAPGL